MNIELQRTFSPPPQKTDVDVEYWLDHYSSRGSSKPTWELIHQNDVSVVVGEAGIGKTFEFKNEAHRLIANGEQAFFVELNQLSAYDDWTTALMERVTAYKAWLASSETGYFFLDAVDEARLTSHAAFKKALKIVLANLSDNLHRVRIAISSRWTDWSLAEVQVAVDELLVGPIQAACRPSGAKMESSLEATPALNASDVSDGPEVKPYVVSLDRLSRPDASRLAVAWGVADLTPFWAAIDEGQYDHMATRPLDLKWLADRWNTHHSFGTYLELIRGNVQNRLTEKNPNYLIPDVALSPDQLRKGAEELAAACEFSGRPYLATCSAPTSTLNEVIPGEVLSGWTAPEIERLLASAVFDGATFGRVKFHHRSVREYLAACWVNRQLLNGVPFHRLSHLFAASPFGEPVLIQSRRWALCWLAALNVKAREWVVEHFPEMFFFDGDAEAWDDLSADKVLRGYVQRLKDGLETDWFNHPGEHRRVARRLPIKRLASYLADPETPGTVKTRLFPIVRHAAITDCAEAVFSIYTNHEAPMQERVLALRVLEEIGTAEQREMIKADLLSDNFISNEYVAAALATINWQTLTVDQLCSVFSSVDSELVYGSGPMARAVKDDLLPSATRESAEMLLEVVTSVLPEVTAGMYRHSQEEQPEHAWLFELLPECLERLLELLPETLEDYPAVCFTVIQQIHALRRLGYTDREDFDRLRGLITRHLAFRWQLALRLVKMKGIDRTHLMVHKFSQYLVWFGPEDMAELIERANDGGTTAEERAVSFAIAKDISFMVLKGPARKVALAALEAGPEKEARREAIRENRAARIRGAKERKRYRAENRQEKLKNKEIHEKNKAELQADIGGLRDGTRDRTLNWLMARAECTSKTGVDYAKVSKDYGQDVADALASGLKASWTKVTPPNPADYEDGSLPWGAIRALAGLSLLFEEGLDIAKLTDVEAARAAQLAVWVLNGPPPWFGPLVTTKTVAVCGALHPWLRHDALSTSDKPFARRTLEVVLRSPKAIQRILLGPVIELLSGGHISRTETVWALVEDSENSLITASGTMEICWTRLEASRGDDGIIGDIRWLGPWLKQDVVGAWSWCEEHFAALGAKADIEVNNFAKAFSGCKWVRMPVDETTIGILLRLHETLSKHDGSAAEAEEDKDSFFGQPIQRFMMNIPKLLVQVRGSAAHRALVILASAAEDARIKTWLDARIYEHSMCEAADRANLQPAMLGAITSPFLSDPQTEALLFEQTKARLEEIREGVEEGPFSDRDLFCKGMDEKKLQLWLAARLLDTPNRRFTVHREEEHDADKRTDIQTSAHRWNVCVEIKPVDGDRGYSANSLTDTLRTQIVGQYLKEKNSTRGILVLFRLDSKTWDIPGTAKRQPFQALVKYLERQAEVIKVESPHVQELVVFSIDCVGKSPSIARSLSRGPATSPKGGSALNQRRGRSANRDD